MYIYIYIYIYILYREISILGCGPSTPEQMPEEQMAKPTPRSFLSPLARFNCSGEGGESALAHLSIRSKEGCRQTRRA